MRISDWSSDVCSSDLPQSGPPDPVLRLGDVIEAPPREEVTDRHAAHLFRGKVADVAGLNPRPSQVRIAALRIEDEAILVRLRVVDVPAAPPGVIPGPDAAAERLIHETGRASCRGKGCE